MNHKRFELNTINFLRIKQASLKHRILVNLETCYFIYSVYFQTERNKVVNSVTQVSVKIKPFSNFDNFILFLLKNGLLRNYINTRYTSNASGN